MKASNSTDSTRVPPTYCDRDHNCQFAPQIATFTAHLCSKNATTEIQHGARLPYLLARQKPLLFLSLRSLRRRSLSPNTLFTFQNFCSSTRRVATLVRQNKNIPFRSGPGGSRRRRSAYCDFAPALPLSRLSVGTSERALTRLTSAPAELWFQFNEGDATRRTDKIGRSCSCFVRACVCIVVVWVCLCSVLLIIILWLAECDKAPSRKIFVPLSAESSWFSG